VDAKTNFLRKALIGKNYWLPPIKIILDIFRVGGKGAEKNLTADPNTAEHPKVQIPLTPR